MNYIKKNKEAWEEAFARRAEGWGEDIKERWESEEYPFLQEMLISELESHDLKDKTIAHFCCNNGRELMSLMKFGAEVGIGFDIAENMVAFANMTAEEIGINCTFVATDILAIDEKYHDSFDYIFITVGALDWFADLSAFFKKVSQCLKEDGWLIINESHPVINMLAAKGESNYDEKIPNKLVNSYFKDEPWVENEGMYYMTERPYASKTFYSYSHTFAQIINSISQNGLDLKKLSEHSYDISDLFSELNDTGIPLSYVLVCQKHI